MIGRSERAAQFDAAVAAVDLSRFGYDIPGPTALWLAGVDRMDPSRWALKMAWALNEQWLEQGRGRFPVPPSVLAEAIRRTMEGR